MADSTAGPGTDDLQFDRAIDAGSPAALACAKCQTPIRMYYYHVNGQTMCSTCKQTVDVAAASSATRSGASMLKAIAYGLGAAIAGAFIYYAVMEYLDLEIGFVAILIGFMVGKAIHKATAGRGSRRFQVLAAALTYLAVAFAYAPFAIRGMFESEAEVSADTATAVGGLRPLAAIESGVDTTPLVASANADRAVAAPVRSSADQAVAATVASSADSSTASASAGSDATDDTVSLSDSTALGAEELGGTGIALAIAGALFFVLALPVIVIFTSMPSGLISALIIGFGMHQAWQLTGGEKVAITGPFKVGGEPPPASA